MDKIWADEWADALESGEFPQGTGRLMNKEGAASCLVENCGTPGHTNTATTYCCLGVLTEVVRRKNPEIGNWNEHGSFMIPANGAFGVRDFLPSAIADLVGLKGSDPTLFKDEDGDPVACSTANDSEGKTFAEIAAYIRENYASM